MPKMEFLLDQKISKYLMNSSLHAVCYSVPIDEESVTTVNFDTRAHYRTLKKKSAEKRLIYQFKTTDSSVFGYSI